MAGIPIDARIVLYDQIMEQMERVLAKKHPTETPTKDDELMGDEYGTWLAVDGEWYELRYILELVEPIISLYQPKPKGEVRD